MEMQKEKMRSVFTIVEKGQGPSHKSYWVRIGIGYVNQDQSITLKLDALPVNGTIQVREYQTQEERERRFAQHRSTPAVGLAE